MNRATTRTAYKAWLRRERDLYGRREEHDLPHHPDGTGWANCACCGGTGMHYHDRDRTGQSDVPCTLCRGDGVVRDGRRDVLVEMREARRWRESIEYYGAQYTAARAISARHPLGMSQLRLAEAAILCDLAARDAAQAWRSAA